LPPKQGRNTEALVQESIARFVDYDEWFYPRKWRRAWRPPTEASF